VGFTKGPGKEGRAGGTADGQEGTSLLWQRSPRGLKKGGSGHRKEFLGKKGGVGTLSVALKNKSPKRAQGGGGGGAKTK